MGWKFANDTAYETQEEADVEYLYSVHTIVITGITNVMNTVFTTCF
jgi:hypothetical protein